MALACLEYHHQRLPLVRSSVLAHGPDSRHARLGRE